MSAISKQALLVDNNQSFPNNNAGEITPSDLRAFNVNVIDSTVNQTVYTTDSGSWNSKINQLNAFTASQQPSFTALNSFTASQLNTNTALNAFTQSANAELDSLSAWTGSWEAWTSSINEIRDDGVLQGYSTRFFFNGLVSASIVQNVSGPIANVTIEQDGTKLNTASFNSYTQSINTSFNSFTSSQNSFNASATASISELLALSSSLSGGYATQGELDQSSSVLQANINVLSSFTASYATTGSNTFIGNQAIVGVQSINSVSGSGTGEVYLLSDSGSLVIGNSTATPTYAALSHLSSSVVNGNTNLIFKTNTNTGDTIISGSGNIFTNPGAATAGYKRYIGGSQNYFGLTLPQITGSAGFSPSMNNNIISTGMLMRLPVSSSTYTMNGNILLNAAANGIQLGTAAATNFEKAVSGFTFNSNFVGGTLQTTAYKTPLSASIAMTGNNIGGTLTLNMDSSSINFNNSIVQGQLTVNNSYFPSTINVNSSLSIGAGLYMGTPTIFASGSNATFTAGKTIAGGTSMIGNGNVISASLNGDSSNVYSTILLGQGLTAVGSNTRQAGATMPDYGTVFVGRFNSIDGTKDMTAETVFAVGTGTAEASRKTGFLIDSGSNTFIEGSLTLTGSAYGNVVSMSITSETASMNLSLGNFYTLTLVSGSTTHLAASNIRPGQTINLLVTQPSIGTGSLSYNSTFDFPAGANYIATPITSSKDIISFISFDTNVLYATSINNLA